MSSLSDLGKVSSPEKTTTLRVLTDDYTPPSDCRPSRARTWIWGGPNYETGNRRTKEPFRRKLNSQLPLEASSGPNSGENACLWHEECSKKIPFGFSSRKVFETGIKRSFRFQEQKSSSLSRCLSVVLGVNVDISCVFESFSCSIKILHSF